MKTRTLKFSILSGFTVIILILGVSIGALGFYIIKKDIIEKAQEKVTDDIHAARIELDRETEGIGTILGLVSEEDDLDEIKKETGLDYLRLVDLRQKDDVRSKIVDKAFDGARTGGVRIIKKEDLAKQFFIVTDGLDIEVISTPKARRSDRKLVTDVMALEYAVPVSFTDEGAVEKVIVGGKIINRDTFLVDLIRGLVFDDKLYDGKPEGTVTIFQDDVRISTNVLNAEGKRAIGTRVSEIVYENVVVRGFRWLDRAFVVTGWYLTAYEPIRDIDGDIVGILYVGILEKPFRDMAHNILYLFLTIILGAAGVAAAISFIIAGAITRPVDRLIKGAEKLSTGVLEFSAGTDTKILELNKLAIAFNEMTVKLEESYKKITISNEKLSALNTDYLDLISFVTHELKGILASTILNAYSLRDGFLGMVNFKQRKVLDAIARNLDHLDATVKNFLNLSRIEKGELQINRVKIKLKEEVLDLAIDTFSRQADEKQIKIENKVDGNMVISGDKNLSLVVVNNLISNAVKYGRKKGRIIIKADRKENENIEISIYNEGSPIKKEDIDRLFKKFSRLEQEKGMHEKGTGLGLFITKEIVEAQNGKITVRPEDDGNTFVFTLKEG